MQRIFNGLSVASFTMSVGVLIGSTMLYSRIPSLTKYYMSELKLELTKVVTDMVPAKIDDVMSELPELPTTTGPAVELPKSPF